MSNTSPTPVSPPSVPDRYRFEGFDLDVRERRLERGGTPVHLSSRYFDLLVALVRRAGTLVDRDTLFEEVWHDVVVGDAALAQGIRSLRRALGDDASQARFIETVSGHGYRFVAVVEAPPAAPPAPRPILPAAPPRTAPVALLDGRSMAGATLGALGSSLVGGLLYGSAFAADSGHPAASLISLVVFSIVVGVVGATSIYAGAALGSRMGRFGLLLGAVTGGLMAGALGEFAGRSILSLITGRAVGDLTGAVEGAFVGAALGIAPFLRSLRWRGVWIVAATGAATGAVFVVLALLGRPLFADSLAAALRPADITTLLPFGLPLALRTLLAALEGLIFGLGATVGFLAVQDR